MACACGVRNCKHFGAKTRNPCGLKHNVTTEGGSSKKPIGPSPFARPIYFLDIRTGYACGWCEIKDGVLTLIPHPDSGEETRTFVIRAKSRSSAGLRA
jgi:hypothetical protein